LDQAERQLGRPSGWLHQQRQLSIELSHRLQRSVHTSLSQRQLRLQPLAMRLKNAAADVPRQMAHRLDKSQWLLRSLDPALVLQRGYAWIQNSQGQALSSVSEFAPGQSVTARLADGEVGLTVNTDQ
jgi:exodeoxyribonuclease VII large subunit